MKRSRRGTEERRRKKEVPSLALYSYSITSSFMRGQLKKKVLLNKKEGVVHLTTPFMQRKEKKILNYGPGEEEKGDFDIYSTHTSPLEKKKLKMVMSQTTPKKNGGASACSLFATTVQGRPA